MAKAASETTVTAETAAMTVESLTVETATAATRTVDVRAPRLAAVTDPVTEETVPTVETATGATATVIETGAAALLPAALVPAPLPHQHQAQTAGGAMTADATTAGAIG